jgi:cytochrome o ubiquinol oxidase operon protein cyoD
MNKLYRSYFVGFGLSLVITLAAFALTIVQRDSGGVAYAQGFIIAVLALLAIGQLAVQMLFFFHLGDEAKPRLNTMSFLFMLMVIGIIVGGTLWIMHNLTYNMTHNIDSYVQQEENIYKTPQNSSTEPPVNTGTGRTDTGN